MDVGLLEPERTETQLKGRTVRRRPDGRGLRELLAFSKAPESDERPKVTSDRE